MNEIQSYTHQEKEQEVFRFFNDIINQEINILFLKDEKNIDRIPSRIQMVLIFSFIDILANYWYEFLNKKAGTGEKFQEWYKEFCQNKKNKQYKGYWKNVSPNRLYKLRCSVVHFFGISEPSEGIIFGLSPNDYPESKRSELSRKLSKPGQRMVALKPHHLHMLVREGGLLMLNSWQSIIRKALKGDDVKKLEYLDGIDRIWRKFRSEGAVRVVLGPRQQN